jgi:16S rRNA (cytidine1402-2'-O)-methyltransferase
LHEEVRRGSVRELADHYTSEPPRGEITLVVGPVAAQAGRREEALVALGELVRVGAHPRRAAAVVARLTGMGTNELYRELARTEQAPSDR